MIQHFVGETAAILTSLMWASCSILFAYAGKKIGALSVNAVRIIIAVGLLGAAHILVLGTIIPQANNSQWFYLLLSGVIGLALGDFGYFGTLVILGPRRGTLLMALAPIFSVIVGFFMLGEILGIWAFIGIAMTISGVIWVILERDELTNEKPLPKKVKLYGVLLGLGGAVGQGVGLVVSKYGMIVVADDSASPLDPLSATLIRMVGAAIFIWVGLIIFGKLSEVLGSLKNKKAISATFGGAVFGPFIGVWLAMIAVTYALTGVAATLMSLMPVMVIPIVWVLYGQRTTWRGFIGASIAILGVAILFLI